MEKVLLGLGSNRSYDSYSPVDLLSRACRELSSFIQDMKVSSVYRTAAMYVEDQDDFYNMVVSGNYLGTPVELLDAIHSVEQKFGRDRSREFRNGPRSLDIDIELFGDFRINTSKLVIPHERMTERAFVLVPFLEVLKENADENSKDIEFYGNKLTSLEGQEINRFLDRSDFLKLV